MTPTLKFVSVHITNFATYTKHTHHFDPGTTLILGKNGAGKSTIIEVVCWTMFGRTLRGKLPAPGAVVELVGFNGKDQFTIKRKRSKTSTDLTFSMNGQDLSAQTMSETQVKMEWVFGTWERFKASRLFSRAFMSRFGASTPKARLELVEGILGHERFDQALHLVKTKEKEMDHALATLNGSITKLDGDVVTWQAELTNLGDTDETLYQAELAHVRWKDSGQADTERIKAIMAAASSSSTLHSELISRRAEVQGIRAEITNQIREAQAKAARLGHITTCPVCIREVDPGTQNNIQAHYAEILDGLNEREQRAANDASQLAGEITEVAEDDKELQHKANNAQQVMNLRAQHEMVILGEIKAANVMKGQAERFAKQLKTAEKAREQGLERLTSAQTDIANIKAMAQTFGPKGARMLLLGKALAIMEAQANDVLREIGGGLKVVLSTTGTQKSGKEVDELSVTIVGAGGGDYDGASEGERSRIDVALMMGVAKLMGGVATGWVAFDEIFDTLDPEGVESVADYLKTMATERQSIVISHHPDMRNLFPRADVWTAVKDDTGSRLVR